MLSLLYKPITYLHFALFSFALHKYLSSKYPEQYKKVWFHFCYYGGYYSIYAFSKVQMLYYKIKPSFIEYYKNTFLSKLFTPNIDSLETIEFIKDGNIVFSTNKINSFDFVDIIPSFDFILYTKIFQQSADKKIMYEIPTKESDFKIEKTNYKFMLIELFIENKVYKIDLSTNIYNYYIVDNKINKAFLLFYLKKHLNNDCIKTPLENYSLKIMDECICIKNCEINDEIILNKTDYQVNKIDYFISEKRDILSEKEEKGNNEQYEDLPYLIEENTNENNQNIDEMIALNHKQSQEADEKEYNIIYPEEK